MNWLTNNWYWILAGIVFILFIVGKASKKPEISRESAERLVDRLIETFDSILANVLGCRISASDRRKIAIGMVAIMAAKGITIEMMQKDPQTVVNMALESAALLLQHGEIIIN